MTRPDDSMARAVFIYSTMPDPATAETIGRALVERRLAACVNIIPGMVSIYRWQNAVERGNELVMIVKTRAALADKASETIRTLHPYDTPVIAVLPLESIDSGTLSWLLDATAAPAQDN
ncbi:MAG: divalent-cation tolerance protein CutA [Xanthobacteraceae bacterium]